MAKKRAVLTQKYKRNTHMAESQLEEVMRRRVRMETEFIQHDDYDDDTYSVTVKIHYK